MKIRKFSWKKNCIGAIIIICIFSIVSLFSSSARGESSNEIVLNLSFTEPVITQWNISNITYHNLSMNETNTIDRKGLPIVPVKQLCILLPQKGIIESININHSINISLGNGYNVTPGGLIKNQSNEQQSPYNETLFNSSIPYPSQLIKNLGISNFRGYNIFMCNLYPVHYINNTGEIYYYQYINLTIITNNSKNISRLFRALERDESLMKQLVDDYSMNYTYNSTLGTPANSTIINYNEELDFVIITIEDFVEPIAKGSRGWKTFQDLADYKNDYTDFKTKIVTIEEILSDSSYYNTGPWGDGDDDIFDDTACRIRNFIKHAHISWGADYFLLGGDISYKNSKEILPARGLWCKDPTESVYGDKILKISSDLYYSCLDGSFNEDKDERWGEPFDGWGSGDWVEPKNRLPENDNYYAEADVSQYKKDFKVGLCTPTLDLSECDYVTLECEYYFSRIVGGPDVAKIRVYSSDPEDENEFDVPSNQFDIEIENIIKDFNSKEEVYVEFYYENDYEFYETRSGDYSWNIDKVLIYEKGDPTNIFLFEDFDKPWIANENDLVPAYGWKQEMYSTAEGKWMKEHYREDVDLIGEVYIGRAPVGTAEEVSNFVSKTLEYEEDISPNDPFVGNLLLVGGRLKHNIWGKEYCNMVRDIIPEEFESTHLYDDKENGKVYYYKKENLKSELNKNHLIFNMDHGAWNKIFRHRYFDFFGGCIQLPGLVTRYHNRDVNKLNTEKPFFWYSGSCHTGNFTREDCLAEHLTVKTKNGAFAVIMNTEESYNVELDDGWFLEEWFYKLLFNGGDEIEPIGKVYQKSKDKARLTILNERSWYNRVNLYDLNLMGDPTVSLICPDINNKPDSPENLTYEKKSNGLYTFNVNTSDSDNDRIGYQFKVNGIQYTRWTRYYNSSNTASKDLMLQPGINTVQVRARDIYAETPDDWTTWSEELSIKVPFDTNIQMDSSPVVLGDEVQFTGMASGGGEPYTSWYYDFNDGNYSQQQNPTHTFGALGTFNVTMNVTDSQNITSNISRVIDVEIINADFDSSPGLAISDQQETFYFNDKSKGYYDIVNWSWDFGDGNISYQRNTSHVYSSEGEYNVSLTVKDNKSYNDTFYQMIYIDSVSPTLESISNNFDVVGLGNNVTISTNISDNSCGIKTVKINITYPDYTFVNYSMNNTNGSIYEYDFSDCVQLGEHSYSVWVVDQADNGYCESDGGFVVSRGFGYNAIGEANQTIRNTITGSRFMVYEKGVADNISVYIDPGNNVTSDSHYQCLIYRHNDSKLIGSSEQRNISCVKEWQMFNFSVPKPVLMNDTEYVLCCWSDDYYSVAMYYDNGTGSEMYYDDGTSTLQGHYYEGIYGYPPDTNNFKHEDRKYSIYCCYTPDNTSPEITNVTDSPDPAGFGFNVTISADIIEYQSGVDIIKVNITYPNSTQYNFDMNYTGNNTYQFVFNNTWIKGQYNYSVWTVDFANNSNISTGYSFVVSGQATVSVCTIKDVYCNNETVNLTDPPGGSPLIGYELLDDGNVLRIWNRFDSYYFDTDSGLQLTNHYDEYWSHNVLMLGYYNDDEWNLIYRTDELSGFNKDIESDNETFVNATIWKNLNYGGYDFRLAIRYNLGVDDNELTVIPYIKNIDQDDIPYVLGFGWEMKDIQIDMTTSGDFINVNRTMYYLNQTLDNIYTGLQETEFYLMENITESNVKSLYLKWNQSLNYKLQVKSRTGQYNAPVTLFIMIGTLNSGQEKYTELFWYDADQVTYYFDSYDDAPLGEAWPTYPGYMVDGDASYYASTTSNGDVELCDSNNCSGTDIGTISKVELRVCSYCPSGQRDTILRPVFGGTIDGMECRYQTTAAEVWSEWFDITYDPFAPQSWGWNDVVNLDCDVITENDPLGPPFTLKCSKIEIRVTFTPSNYEPVISNPVPLDDATGITISPILNITISDPDGDTMNITWLSNSSGSWTAFATNNTVSNGTYHQTFSNATVNGQWWYWKVNVNDGVSYTESSVYKFYTGYQSKIDNTGSTNFTGYLLMQIEFYNSTNSTWIFEQEIVNETTPRTINASDVLALDTIFNPYNVSTSSFTNGDGTYRVYVSFRDPDGDVLVCNDESLMEDSYQFTISTS